MSFFSGSSDFAINGGTFTNNIYQGTTAETALAEAIDALRQLLRKTKEGDDSGLRVPSVGLEVFKKGEVDLRTELISRKNYRIHSASHGPTGRVAAVKVFEGPCAKSNWTKNVDCSTKHFHPNLLKVVGISDGSSEPPFIVFHGISEKRMQSLIANALRTDLNTSVQISMRAVKGLAAGLNYLQSQNFPLHSWAESNNTWIWEDFDIFAGGNNEPVIAIHPPSTGNEDISATESFDVASHGYGIEALDGLCRKLFSETNSILYDDSPEREFEEYDPEDFSTAAVEEEFEETSIVSENGDAGSTSNTRRKSKPSRIPRREVWWRQLDMSVSNRSRSLDEIARLFADRLDGYFPSSFDSPLRRIKAPKADYSSHQCPGYLRQEITLASDLSKSAIIFHESPSGSELCSVCGQLVNAELGGAELVRWTRFAMKGGIGKCKALYDHVAKSQRDLMFLKDEEIIVLLKLPDQARFYLGYCKGVVGRLRGTDVRFLSKLKKPIMIKRTSVVQK